MKCDLCGVILGLDIRWVLLDEIQKCIWTAPDEMPTVDIKYATFLGNYCCKPHAIEACNTYLTLAEAKATWSDVRPIEECGICSATFNTNTWHRVLTLSQERGYEASPEIINGEYVARFCQTCVPCD